MSRARIMFCLCLMLLVATTVIAQNDLKKKKTKDNYFKVLTEQYFSGKWQDTVYMSLIDSVAALSLDKGLYYDVGEMTTNLKQYEKIAWSKEQYAPYRIDYFIILLNNSFLSHRWGSSIYYAEKISKQNEIEGLKRSFIEPAVKTYIYSITGQDKKQVEVYEKYRNSFYELALNIQKDPEYYYWDATDALRILEPVTSVYLRQKDTLNADKTYKLAKSLIQNIKRDNSLSINSIQITDFYDLVFDYYNANALNKKADIKAALNSLDALLKKDEIIGDEYTYNLLRWKTEFFLSNKQVDSASFYILKMDETPYFAQDQKVVLYQYKAELELLKGNVKKSNELLNKALTESNNVQKNISKELNDLLYAYTQAEHHQIAFQRSEEEKKVRNTWIVIISLLLFLVIVIAMVLLRLKDQRLNRTIKDLEETANRQISLMNHFELEVRKEEQERIAQDLHDDLAGILAAIKNNIEIQILETEDHQTKEKLLQFSNMVKIAFINVRSKSHELFEKSQLPSEEMFCQYINHLAQIAFPESYYKVNIEVDDYSMVNTSIEFRSELIKVIQEAFTNIVKHASATQVELLIYKEDSQLVVIIKDNGKGIRTKNSKSNLGLKGMEKRLKKFNAHFSFNNDKSGFEIVITVLPV